MSIWKLIGARQAQARSWPRVARAAAMDATACVIERQREVALMPRITDADRAAHRDFVATLGEKALWQDYLADGA